MNLTLKQKSNIRRFIYYLVNGSLDFESLHNPLSANYHDYLKSHPELFYKTCCVFINQEAKLDPSWPEVKRLAEFICEEVEPHRNQNTKKFERWELDFEIRSMDLPGSFKSFTQWFIVSTVVEGIGYTNYINEGASFVERCFAVWADAIEFEDNRAVTYKHSISRVTEYINWYYDPTDEDDGEERDWPLPLKIADLVMLASTFLKS